MVKMFRRSNGVLYVEYEAYGKIVQKSTRLKDTPKNRSFVKREVIPVLEGKILRGDLLKEKPKEFQFYSDLYLKEKIYLKSFFQIEKQILELNRFFGSIRVDKITRTTMKGWIQDRLQINTPKTVKDYLTHIRGVLYIAIDQEVIKDNPTDNLKLPQHHKQDIEPFSGSEVAQILSEANDWFGLFLSISFYTGMRTGEVLGLTRADIDIDSKIIHIRRSISKGKISTPKTKNSIRTVPILDDLVPYLKKLPKSIWIFPKENGQPYGTVSGHKKKEWSRLLEDCVIPYRKLYSTRHTFIVSMLKHSDLSMLEIAQIVGHNSTQMIIQNYGKFIKGEHLKIDRSIRLFTDKSTDSIA